MAEEPTSVQDPTTAGSAEDRKTAAAMDKLDARGEDADEGAGKAVNKLDAEALQATIKQLSIGEKAATAASGAAKKAGTAAKVEEKKHIKVDQADVTLLVEQLEMPKNKATEFLRAHDGDAIRALTAFVSQKV